MGLNLILGRAGAGKTFCCLSAVQERLASAPDGSPLLVLVPEQATFQTEKQLAAAAGGGGFIRAHVLGFRRLAHTVLAELGGAAIPRLSDLGKRLVLRRLLTEYRQQLKILGRAAGQRTFADTLAGIIREFKIYDISPLQLTEAQAAMEASPLADKIHDLALLYSHFEEYLQGRYTDPEDDLKLLLNKMPQSTLLRGAEVWIDGFEWFTPQEYDVVERLLATAADVTVTLCLDNPDGEEHKAETALFHRQWNTRRVLRDLAAKQGVAIQELQLSAAATEAKPILVHIEQNYFSGDADLWAGDRQGVMVAEAANRQAEIEGMARQMLRLCREEGYRWRDMAVLVRDTDAYSALLERVLADYDIPFFSDRQRPAVHHPLAELLRSALEVMRDHWSYDPIFRCLKTDLFSLTRGQIDKLENYVLEFGIRGSRWTNGEPWQFVRRLSLNEDDELTAGQQAELSVINNIRRLASAPLLELERQLKEVGTVTGYTHAIYSLLEALEVPVKLENWAAASEAAGDLDQAREHRQLWNSVINLFDQMVETCGDTELSLAEYADVLNEGLEGLALSLIPPGLDYVTVAPLTRTRMTAPIVFLPGVNDGVLPKRGREEGLLNDSEREMLANMGMSLAPGALADTFAEQYVVYTALTRASRLLWISYPLADEEGKGLLPSLLLKRLKEIGVVRGIKSLPLEPIPGSEREYIAHRRRSLALLASGLRPLLNGEAAADTWWDVYNWAVKDDSLRSGVQQVIAGLFHRNQEDGLPPDIANKLYRKNNRLRGSVTRFEGFRSCPFQHFARYGLGLKERALAQLAAPDFGQFLHAALKDFGDLVSSQGRQWGDVKDDEISPLCTTIIEQLAPKLQNEILLSSAQHKHITGRLQRTIERTVQRLVKFDRVSKFKPLALELPFGREEGLPALTLTLRDGSELELVGQIDRVDAADHDGRQLLAIVDYKSGGAWLKLPDVYYGLRLQLLTYLLVALRYADDLLGAAECLPAGVLYCFVKNPKVSSNYYLPAEEAASQLDRALKMPGWLLEDAEAIRAWDSSIAGRSDFIKIGIKKDSTFYSDSKPYLKTTEQFALLLDYVQNTLIDTAERILAGDAAIRPYSLEGRTPCGLCSYLPVCQFDRMLPDNDFVILPSLADDDILALLSGKGGDDA